MPRLRALGAMPLRAILPTDRLQNVRQNEINLPQFFNPPSTAVLPFRSTGALSAYLRAACAAGPHIEPDYGSR
jgi:hypothetical protein